MLAGPAAAAAAVAVAVDVVSSFFGCPPGVNAVIFPGKFTGQAHRPVFTEPFPGQKKALFAYVCSFFFLKIQF